MATGPIPLSRNLDGASIDVPSGATAWRIWRLTGGRPRALLDDGRQPIELPLTAGLAKLADEVGPGRYRLRAVSDDGELLGVSIDHEIEDDEDDDGAGGPLASASALQAEVVGQLVQALVESNRAMASMHNTLVQSQAAWIQTLAEKRALPKTVERVVERAELDAASLRNAAVPPAANDEQLDEDDDDEGDDEAAWVRGLRDVIDVCGGPENLPVMGKTAAAFVADAAKGIRDAFAGTPPAGKVA